ncbi:MAG: stage III sporulation protein AE [Clostridia bacterium]|nr:stage III sporulation protein AE [Clostridia bacterium]
MKKLIFAVIVFLICTFGVHAAETSDVRGIIEEYAKIYGKEISQVSEDLENVDFDEFIPGFQTENIIADIASGETVFSVSTILEKGIAVLFGEMKNTVRLLVVIIAISILSAYLISIQGSFQSKGATNAAFFVCYLVVSGITSAALLEVVGCGKVLVENISVFMRMLVPVIMVSLMSSGAPVTATSFELVMVGIIELTEWLVEVFFIPMLMMSAALSIVNNLTETMEAGKLIQFLNKTIKWGIGIVMTVFVGVMNLQGIVSGSADGLAVKITKFATSNLIPVVGGALAETVETVINCGAVIKNSVGVLGIIMVVLMAAVPLLKTAACLIMFRLCAAVLQPIADKRIVKSVSDISDSVSGIFGLVAAVTVMFVIMLTIIIKIVV